MNRRVFSEILLMKEATESCLDLGQPTKEEGQKGEREGVGGERVIRRAEGAEANGSIRPSKKPYLLPDPKLKLAA